MNSTNWLAKRLSSIRTDKQRIGDAAEEQALHYLKNVGLQLVERSFLCKGGEIDLIMRDQSSLVFVEVRKRKSQQFGGALASITVSKQKRMIHAAQVYLCSINPTPACRFDVIAIDGDKLEWIKNVIIQA